MDSVEPFSGVPLHAPVEFVVHLTFPGVRAPQAGPYSE